MAVLTHQKTKASGTKNLAEEMEQVAKASTHRTPRSTTQAKSAALSPAEILNMDDEKFAQYYDRLKRSSGSGAELLG